MSTSATITAMPESTISLRINSVLLRDAERLAVELEMETERFIEEVLEAYVAGKRLNKTVPVGKTWRKPQKIQ